MSRQGLWAIILVVLLATLFINLPNNNDFFGRDTHIRQGLDLQGGLQVLLEADLPAGQVPDSSSMDVVRQVIENRVNGLGVSEPVVQSSPPNRIVVELPGYDDPDQAIALIRNTALLEFVEVPAFVSPGSMVKTTFESGTAASGTAYPTATSAERLVSGLTATPPPATPTATLDPNATPLPPVLESTAAPTAAAAAQADAPTPPALMPTYKTIMTGKNLKSARVAQDELGQYVVEFALDSDGAAIFTDYTRNHIGDFLAIVLDKMVISCPQIQSIIPGGTGSITGNFTSEEANHLAIQLNYGALPVPLKVVRTQAVGPTLGQDSLRRSLIAGAIGVITVALFMLLYYRLPGALADVALAMYALTTLAVYRLIPVTFTLPGIAGFILSVGMAVDANVLIFERMKEELRAGRTLREAVEIGFSRAWLSIRDSNLSTFITCAILYWFGGTFGASIVKGFALTLATGVAISMFTAIVVTRNLLHLVLDRMDFSQRHSWFGL